MSSSKLPEDPTEQWDALLLLISSEEKSVDRRGMSEPEVMKYFLNKTSNCSIMLTWLDSMKNTYGCARPGEPGDVPTKSDTVAELWREIGNSFFRELKYKESSQAYNRSLFYAESESSIYSVALANRSAAMFELQKYEDCISDVDAALQSGYQKEQRFKLYTRMANCYLELGKISEAKEAIENATKEPPTKPYLIKEYEVRINILRAKIASLTNLEDVVDEDVLPALCHGENDTFANASNALKLKRNENTGRFVVASKPLQRGNVIFMEEPYAFVSLPLRRVAKGKGQDMSAVCEACCERKEFFLPCKVCSRASYCSFKCLKSAWAIHHRWECVGGQAKLWPVIGIAHLALRVLLVTAYNGFPDIARDKTCDRSVTAAQLFAEYSSPDSIEVYKEDVPAFYRMFNLVTNLDKMPNVRHIQFASSAAMLTLYLLKYTEFFEYLPSKLPYKMGQKEMILFVSAFVLRSLGQLVCNGHGISNLFKDVHNENVRSEKEVELRYATAIFPSTAMMNHACESNIINTFYKSKLIIVCNRDIAAGSEIRNCYGPSAPRQPTSHRQKLLHDQYQFKCTCDACTSTEWEGEFIFNAYSCPSCKGPVIIRDDAARCLQCKTTDINLQELLGKSRLAAEYLAEANLCKDLEEMCGKTRSAYKLQQKVWYRHHQGLRITADKLAEIYVNMGQYTLCVELIKQNIQTLEFQYGPYSCEIANELRKLSDVMLTRVMEWPQHEEYREWCLETDKILKKAIMLMELNYGSWEPLVKTLKCRRLITADLLQQNGAINAEDIHQNLHYNLKI